MDNVQKLTLAKTETQQSAKAKIAQAEAMENAALKLREEAAILNATAAKMESQINVAKKEARMDRFSNAMATIRQEGQEAEIKAAGWIFESNGHGGNKVYGKPGRPGLRLVISNGKFFINHGARQILGATSLERLRHYINTNV